MRQRGSCRQLANKTELSPEVEALVHDHPCYSEEAHYHYARIHLPVAPACNIQCRYCNRLYDCVNESRPGVTSQVLTPEQAARKTEVIVRKVPRVTVVGIAGPGDPLANPERTFRTFELVSEKVRDVRFCISTNGLTLLDHVDRLKEMGVDHVTITINAVDPRVGKDVYQWVHFDHKRYEGEGGAAILIERQLGGLQALQERGILCKVNSVLIPGVNDEHLVEVSRKVKSLGAFLHNIMPLIVVQGSDFAKQGFRAPTIDERKRLQGLCEGQIRLMHHCRQCRSDAIGLLSEDLSMEFGGETASCQDAEGDALRRQLVRQQAEEDVRRMRRSARELAESPAEDIRSITAAVASRGNGVVNQHFGHAREFLIYEASALGIRLVQVRNVEQYCRGPATCGDEEELLSRIAAMLSDCQFVVCSRIGLDPRRYLEQRGIRCVEAYDFIHDVLGRLVLQKEPQECLSQ